MNEAVAEVCHIVAVDQNHCIGKENRLPWHIPSDLKYFRDTTRGCPVIMGRKTHESIGRPLPGRTNIVLSRQKKTNFAPDILVFDNFKEALSAAKKIKPEQVFVIGGGQIYHSTLSLVDKVYLTKVETQIKGGDAFYPMLSKNEFSLVSEKRTYDTYNLNFQIYKRVKK